MEKDLKIAINYIAIPDYLNIRKEYFVMKKLGIIALGIAMSAVFAFTAPTTVKAEGMPCTETELQKAEAQMASAQKSQNVHMLRL